MKKIYKATKGAQFTQAEAQEYGEELGKIEEENNGTIKREDVVERARNRRNPLHSYFEWDNEKAGERHRMQQAQHLISHITVIVKQDHKQKEYRAFFSVNSTPNEKLKNKVYVTIERVLSEPELRTQILETAIEEVVYWNDKYKQYKELGRIFSAIKETKKRIQRKIKKKRKKRR